MIKKKKRPLRLKGWVLQFVSAFGLTISVLLGFYLGYLIGGRSGGQSYGGVLGALVGLVLGLAGLIYLAHGENQENE